MNNNLTQKQREVIEHFKASETYKKLKWFLDNVKINNSK